MVHCSKLSHLNISEKLILINIFSLEIPSRRGDGEGQAQREGRGRGSTGLSRVFERSYVEESSSDEDQRFEVVLYPS